METNQIYGIAKELQYKCYDSKALVFAHGEVADTFFIILSGSVRVFIPVPMEAKTLSSLKEVMRLEKGEAFGELALLYDSQRTATIVTDERCEFIVLDKESFRKHIKTISTGHMSQIVEFYRDFPAFQALSNKEITKYASKSLFYKFPSNTVVIREGDQPAEIFFIKSGRVKIIRRLNFKVHPVTKNILLDDPREPTKEDIEKGLFKSMLIEIDEISTGDSFCDSSILNKEPMHHTIVCSMPCELIALPYYDLKDMDEHLLEQYQAICKTYPDDTELRKTYLDVNRWNSWKKNLYDNIQIDKVNKRRGFSQQLRKPFIKKIQLEKITIPIEADVNSNLLRMLNDHPQTTRAAPQSRLIESVSRVNLNKGKPESIADFPRTTKGRVPSLPKIPNVVLSMKDTSSGRIGSYSHREHKVSASKIKFDFVVPKHKMAQMDEKETTADGTGNEFFNYKDFDQFSNTELSNSQAKAMLQFNLEDITSIQENPGDDISKKSGEEGGNSVLGTRNMAKTFTKVFNQMNLGLPSLNKKHKGKEVNA